MNKVDSLVKRMMLKFPDLYPNRFMAFAEIMTNSCFEWGEDGSIVDLFPIEPIHPQSMVDHYESKLIENQTKHNPETCVDVLKSLYKRYVAEAEAAVIHAKHVAANIDIYVSEYTDSDWKTVDLWLFNQDRYGISQYWTVNNPPQIIDEEWRAAIHQWFRELLPRVNGLFGIYHDHEGWTPQKRYAQVFIWAYSMSKVYESKEYAARLQKIQQDLAERISKMGQS
jgi:hypothetical protein